MIPLRIYFRIFYYLRARFVVANLIKMTENIMYWQSVLVCWGDKYSNAQVNKLVDQIIKRDLGITSLFGSSCMYFPQNHVFASGAAANLLGFV